MNTRRRVGDNRIIGYQIHKHVEGGETQIFHQFHVIVFQFFFTVLIIDYRGYGQSTGKASEQGTYLDAQAAWDYLVDNRGISPGKIVLFGRSLGGAVAAWLAAHTAPGAVMPSGMR